MPLKLFLRELLTILEALICGYTKSRLQQKRIHRIYGRFCCNLEVCATPALIITLIF